MKDTNIRYRSDILKNEFIDSNRQALDLIQQYSIPQSENVSQISSQSLDFLHELVRINGSRSINSKDILFPSIKMNYLDRLPTSNPQFFTEKNMDNSTLLLEKVDAFELSFSKITLDENNVNSIIEQWLLYVNGSKCYVLHSPNEYVFQSCLSEIHCKIIMHDPSNKCLISTLDFLDFANNLSVSSFDHSQYIASVLINFALHKNLCLLYLTMHLGVSSHALDNLPRKFEGIMRSIYHDVTCMITRFDRKIIRQNLVNTRLSGLSELFSKDNIFSKNTQLRKGFSEVNNDTRRALFTGCVATTLFLSLGVFMSKMSGYYIDNSHHGSIVMDLNTFLISFLSN